MVRIAIVAWRSRSSPLRAGACEGQQAPSDAFVSANDALHESGASQRQ